LYLIGLVLQRTALMSKTPSAAHLPRISTLLRFNAYNFNLHGFAVTGQ
jgi:hypothetical protein